MIQDGRTDWNISQTLADKLNALKDTRITVYAQSKGGKYEGIPNGLPDAIATTYLSTAAGLGTYFTQASTPSVLMTHAELQFILAEAALDGDIPGNARTYFEEGIKASFKQYGLEVPAGYLDQFATVSKETVMEQKWIALFGQGVEAWTEYRRTGLPVLPSRDPRSVFENDAVLPTRLKYPTSEETLNAAHLQGGIELNGGPDNMKTRLWWTEN